jgi:hypothetical protein
MEARQTVAGKARRHPRKLVHRYFAAWNDPAAFEKVYIDPESHTVAWPSDIDLCPESLYQEVLAMSDTCCVRDKPKPTN